MDRGPGKKVMAAVEGRDFEQLRIAIVKYLNALGVPNELDENALVWLEDLQGILTRPDR